MDKVRKADVEKILYEHLQKYRLNTKVDLLYYNLFHTSARYWGLVYDTKPKIINVREDSFLEYKKYKPLSVEYLIQYLNKNADIYKEFCGDDEDTYILYIIDNILIYFYNFSDNPSNKEFICYSCDKPTRLLEGLKLLKVERKESEFTFITAKSDGAFVSTNLTIRHNLNVSLDNYNSDLPYERMKSFVESDESGLMLFSGECGTGKTSLVKKLIHDCDKIPFYFMSSETLLNINSNSFINYLIKNASGAVLVLEDCDIILQSRDNCNNQVMSTLLNLSDGILGDALNLKFICTYNTDDNNVDKAVLRKGRLKLKYTFRKLSADRVHKINPKLNTEMTLADLYNQEENKIEKKTKKIGF